MSPFGLIAVDAPMTVVCAECCEDLRRFTAMLRLQAALDFLKAPTGDRRTDTRSWASRSPARRRRRILSESELGRHVAVCRPFCQGIAEREERVRQFALCSSQ